MPDFESVISALAEAVVVLSVDGTVVWLNAYAESLLGASGPQLIGRSAAEAFASNPWIASIGASINTERPLVRLEESLSRGGEDDIAMIGHGALVVDAQGNRTGVVINMHPAAVGLRLAAQERERARLAELHRLVGQFGHELNNPLSGIRGAAQLMGRKLGSHPEALEYTSMIVRQADRMAALVADLMSLEAPVVTPRPSNIHRTLSDVMLLLGADDRAAGVKLIADFDPSLPDVAGDPDRLQQLFLNLTKNALQACLGAKGPRIVVRTFMEHGFHVSLGRRRVRYIRVEVRDNGPGLNDETVERMFEPLYSRTTGGHGMGLAVARSIVTAHGGSIVAENLEGGGASLRVLLPVAEEVEEVES